MPLDLERCDCGSKQHHCPECGSDELSAEVRINHTIRTDGGNGIEYADPHHDSFGAFERLECAMCRHELIVGGEIVDDSVTGTTV